MLGNRTSDQWIAQYSSSHQHPVNRVCHTFGIPLIVLSLAVAVAGFFFHRLWLYAELTAPSSQRRAVAYSCL